MRVSQLAKERVLIDIVFCEGPRMGVASMVAAAQATAMAAVLQGFNAPMLI
jgi:hypothetical protein